MRVFILAILSAVIAARCFGLGASADAGAKRTFRIYEIDGKPSPLYGHLMQDDEIFEIDMTKLAYFPIGADPSKYTGATKGKLIRIYKGEGRPGKENC